MNKHVIWVTALAAGILVMAASLAKEEQGFNREFNVSAGGTLVIDSDSGSIQIESHDSDTVEIEVETRGPNAKDFQVNFEQQGKDVRVEGELDRGWGNYSLSVRFRVKVPENYNLDLKTGGGSIDIENLQGEIEAYTSGGSIELGQVRGDVKIKTSGGSISIDDVAGNVNAHTSGGSIKARLSKQLTDDCKLTTSGGSISAYLIPDMAVDLYASTSGGRVKSEFDVDGTVKKTKIRGQINGGGPELELKTSGGSVSIKKL